MANSYSEQVQERRTVLPWLGFWLAAAGMLVAGVLLATQVQGVAKPWTGLGLAIGAGLAAVVGASKTSSA